jgi:tRNA threonylcarbamoyladenosine biosynthesis protein TsaE
MEITYTLEQLPQTATAFWTIASGARVIAFHGNMGTGKTTFIHALCDARGVKDVFGSPTFSIINEYFFLENSEQRKIFHIDLYRLAGANEAVRAGVEDCLYSDHVCLIEWPEKIATLLPPDTLHVFMEFVHDETRKLRIGGN